MPPFDRVWLFGTSVCFYLKEDPHAIHMTTSWHHAGYLVLRLSRLGAEFPELPLDPGRSGNTFPGCRRGALLLGDDCHENFVWCSLSDSLVLGLHTIIPYDIIDWYYRQIYIPNHIYIYISHILSYIMLRKTDANAQSYQYKTWMIHEFAELRQEFRCGAWQGGWLVDDILVSPWCEEGYMKNGHQSHPERCTWKGTPLAICIKVRFSNPMQRHWCWDASRLALSTSSILRWLCRGIILLSVW